MSVADRSRKEIGFTHMRILEGVGTLIQLAGLVARLCKLVGVLPLLCGYRFLFSI